MSKRLVPLVALVVTGFALACNGGEEDLGTTTPGPSSGRTPAALLTMTPTPAATQEPLSPTQPVALEEGASVTEWGVYLVEVPTGRLWRLDGGGAWSPDGKSLVSWGCCIGEGGLDVIDVPGGPAVRLYSGDVRGAAWSPDGDEIAFSPAQGGGLSLGLYLIKRDGSGLKRLSDTVTSVGEWSSAGDRIAFQDQGLYLLEVATGEVSQIPDATVWPWHPLSLSWSPDGSLLAFVNDSGLYVYDPDTGDRRQIAIGPSGGPILWSPDGSKIVFRFGPGVPFPHSPEVTIQAPYVVEAKGGTEPKPLPTASTMSWSPDGSRIAYLEHGCITGNWDIYTVAADGSSEVRLTTMPEGAKEGPYWSPTGATIAFSTFGELILLDADSGEMRTLVVSGGPEPESYSPGIHLHGPVWSSDGRYIEFAAGYAHGICD